MVESPPAHARLLLLAVEQGSRDCRLLCSAQDAAPQMWSCPDDVLSEHFPKHAHVGEAPHSQLLQSPSRFDRRSYLRSAAWPGPCEGFERAKVEGLVREEQACLVVLRWTRQWLATGRARELVGVGECSDCCSSERGPQTVELESRCLTPTQMGSCSSWFGRLLPPRPCPPTLVICRSEGHQRMVVAELT